MLGMDIAAGETIVGKTETCHRSGIVALLGLTGERSGTGQMYCQPGFGCKIASRMLMAEYESVEEDVLDAIAEVANMIVGNIKNMLEPKLGPMGLSTPNIVFGGEFDTRIAGHPDQITVPFTCEEDIMTVQVVLAPKRAGLAGMKSQKTEELAMVR
jgi:chemotaxis protein CheX